MHTEQQAVATSPMEGPTSSQRTMGWRGRFAEWALAADLILIVLTYGAVLAVVHPVQFQEQVFSYNLAALLVVTLGFFWVSGRYERKMDIRSSSYCAEFVIIAAFMAIVMLLYVLALRHFVSPPMIPMRGLMLSVAIINLGAWLTRRWLFNLSKSLALHRFLVLVGSGDRAKRFLVDLRQRIPDCKVHVFSIRAEDQGKPVIPSAEDSPIFRTDLGNFLAQSQNQEGTVILAEDTHLLDKECRKSLIFAKFSHLEVQTLAEYHAEHWGSLPEYDLSPFWNLEESSLSVHGLFCYGTCKRVGDVLVASLAILLLVPVAVITACAIRIDSKGPILFRQTRVGFRGRRFTLYKFRSMTLGSENGDVYTREGDVRITRIGRFLRLSRLDEIPQLWNVLRGDMSLIGPRPEWDVLVERYENAIDYYHFRHLVRPGISGWAQVNYPYGSSIEDTVEKLKYDLFYVLRCSPKLDLMVIIKTVYTMLGFRGR